MWRWGTCCGRGYVVVPKGVGGMGEKHVGGFEE